jgi:WD40 repeat protein
VCKHTQGPPIISQSEQQFEPARGCCVSGLEWGQNRTSDLLFLTWQPHRQRKFSNRRNFHQSLGIQDGKLVYNFSTSAYPGSALSLSPDGIFIFKLNPIEFILPTGSRIALATYTGTSHKLSIFDVRAGASKLVTEQTIQRIPLGRDIEHLKFDPSGEYLAVGRSDNVVQILDTRMGTILHTLHHGESVSTQPPSERYGITAMEWVTGWHGCGVRLLTGGEDGEQSTI